jgi:hypothetical protein
LIAVAIAIAAAAVNVLSCWILPFIILDKKFYVNQTETRKLELTRREVFS